jgi:hypothetical protein
MIIKIIARNPIPKNPANQPNIKPDIDKGLIAMFLKLSFEKRLAANDNAICTIHELKDARGKLRLQIFEETLRQMKKESHASIKSKNAQTDPCGTAPGF